MVSDKTTGKAPVLQVSALTHEEHQTVLRIAKEENRTNSQMGATLIREALSVRCVKLNNSAIR